MWDEKYVKSISVVSLAENEELKYMIKNFNHEHRKLNEESCLVKSIEFFIEKKLFSEKNELAEKSRRWNSI